MASLGQARHRPPRHRTRLRAGPLALGRREHLRLAAQPPAPRHALGTRPHHPYRLPDPRLRLHLLALPHGVLKPLLSQAPSLAMEPITDQRDYFREPGGALRPVDTSALRSNARRGSTGRPTCPGDTGPANRSGALQGKTLGCSWELQRLVESRLLDCAGERHLQLRSRMPAVLKADVEAGVAEISARLRAALDACSRNALRRGCGGARSYRTGVTRDPFPAGGALAAPLAELIRHAPTGGKARAADQPLAYAALAQKQFA